MLHWTAITALAIAITIVFLFLLVLAVRLALLIYNKVSAAVKREVSRSPDAVQGRFRIWRFLTVEILFLNKAGYKA